MGGARHFKELIVWQLANQLRIETVRLTSRAVFSRDLKLRGQTEDAVNSACRNIAEGFGCETHREFARFLRIARRSLNELQDAYEGALQKQYISDADLEAPHRLKLRGQTEDAGVSGISCVRRFITQPVS